jgi:hypothetical protein
MFSFITQTQNVFVRALGRGRLHSARSRVMTIDEQMGSSRHPRSATSRAYTSNVSRQAYACKTPAHRRAWEFADDRQPPFWPRSPARVLRLGRQALSSVSDTSGRRFHPPLVDTTNELPEYSCPRRRTTMTSSSAPASLAPSSPMPLATLPRPGRPTLPPATSSQASYNVGPPRPLRVYVLERSLAEPDRSVCEVLPPGGMRPLKALGPETARRTLMRLR